MKRSHDENITPRKRTKCETQTVSLDDDSNSSITTPDLRSDEESNLAPLPLSQAIQNYFGRGASGLKNRNKAPSIPLNLPAIPELPELPTTAERPVGGSKNHSGALSIDDNIGKSGIGVSQGKKVSKACNPNLVKDAADDLDMSIELPEPSPSVSSPEPTPKKKNGKDPIPCKKEVSVKIAVSTPQQENVRNTVIAEKPSWLASLPQGRENVKVKGEEPTAGNHTEHSKATALNKADWTVTPCKPSGSLGKQEKTAESPELLDPKDLPPVDSGQDTDVSPKTSQQPLPNMLSKERLISVQRDLVRGYKEVVTSEGGISDAKLGALLIWLGVPRGSVERHVRRILRRPGKMKSRTNLKGILKYFNRVFT